ncbi:hypothetical protein [Methylophaga frappieri]|uniref:hypothetical protein n=1 Tax=Methylophaga frappieri (strain ATCC BAA-2434 / DSM 25690 / JAM7) TaxID=754477 RepID=UPI001243AC6C|nr:hypothetical protein [Methylophaga frappieri]
MDKSTGYPQVKLSTGYALSCPWGFTQSYSLVETPLKRFDFVGLAGNDVPVSDVITYAWQQS